jgi:hypothetical protein
MGAKEPLENDVNDKEEKKERQRPEPAADIEKRDVARLGKAVAVPD